MQRSSESIREARYRRVRPKADFRSAKRCRCRFAIEPGTGPKAVRRRPALRKRSVAPTELYAPKHFMRNLCQATSINVIGIGKKIPGENIFAGAALIMKLLPRINVPTPR